MSDLTQFARNVCKSGALDASGILALRRAVYGGEAVSRKDSETLFAIERTRTEHSDAWSALFVEALTDYAINQELPVGYLSEDTARWLMAELDKHKRPSTDAEIELFVNIIEKAREVPPAFSAYSLGLVKSMVMYGGGPDATGRPHEGGRITAADIDALQRILWGAGAEGLLAISREEAEVLFSIAHASAGHDNDPRFDEFFAGAVANYLLGATGRTAAPRETALRWQTEDMTGDGAHLLHSVMDRYSQADWSELKDPHVWSDTLLHPRSLEDDVQLRFDNENKKREADAAIAEVMSSSKAGWLLDHIGLNGVMTEPEKALVRFIKRNARQIDPSLQDAITKAGG